MKTIVLITTLLAIGLLPVRAVYFDVDGFGNSLHGWNKDRTATYSINNYTYRTHRPTGTDTKSGGLFLSVKIEEAGRYSGRSVGFLELTYSRAGELVAAQIRATIADKRLDTGLVTRAPEAPVDLEGEGGGAASPLDALSPTDRLVLDLFSALDTELNKLDPKDGEKPRRDLFGRLSGRSSNKSDFPAALRHNMNLLLPRIGPGGRAGTYK